MNEPASLPDQGQPAASTGAREDQVLFQVTSGTLARALHWFRRALGWLTAGYVIGLLALLIGLEWWGERSWIFSVLLYAPIQTCLLPLAALTPVCLLFRWRLILWHFGAAIILVFGFMTFRWSSVPPVTGSELKAVTFNCGESNRPQFISFLEAEKPDLIILQDARNSGANLVMKFPGMYSSDLGQFAFVSKFPIQKASLVESVKSQGAPVAARCEIVFQGRTTAVYSVHLPTPRDQLSRFIGGRRVLGDLVGSRHRAPAYGDYREWIQERIRLAQALAAVLAEEKEPMIVGGDFNTPDHGHIYHLLAGGMTDAFAHAGRGWGLTFPGSTHNPISFFGPWLRIDYFFVGRGWRVTECRPEPGNKSQHKAVFARFEPQPTG
ncbi:MAG: endonuclease/exonuclease/phosphatase family protein [Chthoniobacter sp.]|uniref:endonuclease/exonuclease/phosphatase family protein n=1 Tax=Chthoniobacter sp. TaxID=2510640 RepID=UPI0032A51CEA